MKKQFYSLIFAQNYVTYHSSLYREFFKKSERRTIVIYEDAVGHENRYEENLKLLHYSLDANEFDQLKNFVQQVLQLTSKTGNPVIIKNSILYSSFTRVFTNTCRHVSTRDDTCRHGNDTCRHVSF